MGSLLNFTNASKGITIIPYLASFDLSLEDKRNIIEFTQPIPVRSIGLLTHKFFVKKQLAKVLQEIIQESVRDLIPKVDIAKVISPV